MEFEAHKMKKQGLIPALTSVIIISIVVIGAVSFTIYHTKLIGSIITSLGVYKKCLLNTTQLAGWMKTGSPKAMNHDIRWT